MASQMKDRQIIEMLKSSDESVHSCILKNVVPLIWPLLQRKFRHSLTSEDLEKVFAMAIAQIWVSRDKMNFPRNDFSGKFFVVARQCGLNLQKQKYENVLT